VAVPADHNSSTWPSLYEKTAVMSVDFTFGSGLPGTFT
jgi:hypothetical protein